MKPKTTKEVRYQVKINGVFYSQFASKAKADQIANKFQELGKTVTVKKIMIEVAPVHFMNELFGI